MQQIRKLLFPFSLLYGIITFIRNKFYDWGWFKSRVFEIPIISVGNLEVGGSGKTPMVEYLIKLLKDDIRLATLSRGYGRKTKGFRWVNLYDDALNSGDEPLQIKQKFDDISVAVCEDRVAGIDKIKENHQLILMDDAYQHRAVKPGLSILLFDFNTLGKTKLLLPAGNYREYFSGKKRADILLVSKCPADLSLTKREKIIGGLKPSLQQHVFFTCITYNEHLYHIYNGEIFDVAQIDTDTMVLLLTGIAKTKPLISELKKHCQYLIHHAYADHHQFSKKNMLKLANDFSMIDTKKKIVITTQKDAVRLRRKEFSAILADLPIYEWPIEVAFVDKRKTEFDNLIKKYAQIH